MRNSSSLPRELKDIAGLVDGSVMIKRDSDGGLSLQLTIGPTGLDERPLLEISLSGDSAQDLSHFLHTNDGQTLRLGCCVGVRAREA